MSNMAGYTNVGIQSDSELGATRPVTPSSNNNSSSILTAKKSTYVYQGGEDEITLDRLLSIVFHVRPFPPSRELTPEEVRFAKQMELKRKCLTKTGYESRKAEKISAWLSTLEAIAIIVLIVINFLVSVPDIGSSVALSVTELVLQLYLAVYVALEIIVFTWACDYLPQYRGKGGRMRFLRTRPMLFDMFILILNIALAMLIILQLSGHEAFSTGLQNAIQTLRLLQLVRLMRLPFVKRALKVLFENMKDKLPTMVLVGVLAFFAMVIFSTLFYMAERTSNDKVVSLPMSLYWATITSVTVGYGDISPVTSWGRLVAILTCWIAVPMFSAIMGIFSTSVALNFEAWEKNVAFNEKKRETAARIVQWWWRFRALQARSPPAMAWVHAHIQQVAAVTLDKPMLTFLLERGSTGELKLVGSIKKESELRRRSSAFADLQKGRVKEGSPLPLVSSSVKEERPRPLVSSLSIGSGTEGDDSAMVATAGTRPGHVVAALIIFMLFRLMYITQLEEQTKSSSDVSTYDLQKDTWRVQDTLGHMNTLLYLRHRTYVREQMATDEQLRVMSETILSMKQQLDSTQTSLAEITRQLQMMNAQSGR